MTDPFKNNKYDYEKSFSLPHSLSDYENVRSAKSNYSLRTEDSLLSDSAANRQAFVQTHIENNRDLIAQLKNNIELLFKATTLAGQCVTFPFKVLRWQCQMNSESQKLHLVPFTLFPVLYNLNYNGCALLWKGCFSVAAYHGIKIVLESVLSEVSGFER